MNNDDDDDVLEQKGDDMNDALEKDMIGLHCFLFSEICPLSGLCCGLLFHQFFSVAALHDFFALAFADSLA